MKTIPLSRGLFATVDNDLYPRLSHWKWSEVAQVSRTGDSLRFLGKFEAGW